MDGKCTQPYTIRGTGRFAISRSQGSEAEQTNRGHLEAVAGQADAAGVRRAPWPRLRVAAKLPLVPDVATTARDVLLAAILLPLLVQWWSTYYPDAEPGGGGWVVQRMLAAKDVRHAAGACNGWPPNSRPSGGRGRSRPPMAMDGKIGPLGRPPRGLLRIEKLESEVAELKAGKSIHDRPSRAACLARGGRADI